MLNVSAHLVMAPTTVNEMGNNKLNFEEKKTPKLVKLSWNKNRFGINFPVRKNFKK